MSGLWDVPGIPHRGWTCVDVIDLREDGKDTDNPQTNYEVCQMCRHHPLRRACDHVDGIVDHMIVRRCGGMCEARARLL